MKKHLKHRHIGIVSLLLLLALLPYQAFAITLAQLQTNIQGIINRTNTTIQWSILIENDNGSTV
ncbi:MAG: hypothetical protein SFY68_03605, partial [Candidatus Sumerlaeia bacterium]|nr:hypothetical protein [Candidatus Sumerlaeia bacterium]